MQLISIILQVSQFLTQAHIERSIIKKMLVGLVNHWLIVFTNTRKVVQSLRGYSYYIQ